MGRKIWRHLKEVINEGEGIGAVLAPGLMLD